MSFETYNDWERKEQFREIEMERASCKEVYCKTKRKPGERALFVAGWHPTVDQGA